MISKKEAGNQLGQLTSGVWSGGRLLSVLAGPPVGRIEVQNPPKEDEENSGVEPHSFSMPAPTATLANAAEDSDDQV